jgi:hypothetical protein
MSAAKGYLQEAFSVSYESLATEYEVTQKPDKTQLFSS